ncbi:MAG TPA: hypothetical protein VML57_18500 [Burkholderiales bacterium]|nr:hypothetical protein [Burkholderiales bacterium]
MTDRRVALAAFAAALLVYLSNASIFPLNADTAPNVYLPASVLNDGDLAFSPFEAPFMFGWKAAGREGDVQVQVTHWHQAPPGSDETFAQHYRDGRLRFDRERYYLVPTLRERSQTGEPLFFARSKTGLPELWQTPLWLGAAGLIVSPSRGLLVYSPFLAAAFAGAVLAWKDPRYRKLRFLTLAVPALWIPSFPWFDWWGGWAYGYRPIVDSVPLLAVLCLPALGSILERPGRRLVFAVALAWSVLIQSLGAFAYSPWGWNAKLIDPVAGTRADVDRPAYRERLWALRDSQIGYLIANFRQARAEREHVISY